MNVKLLTLKSGEDVVADVTPMCVGEKEDPTVVGYYLNLPARVILVKNASENPDRGDDTPLPCRMQLTPWQPLSKDEVIPIVVDWVITITDPIDELKEAYEKGVKVNEDRKRKAAGTGGSETDSDSD